MFLDFFDELRAQEIPVSLREFLDLLAALEAGEGSLSLERFYCLARTVLVKDEKYYDRFDQVFGHRFQGLAAPEALEPRELPAEWLKRLGDAVLSEELRRRVEAAGGFDEILDALRRRLAEQKERHQGGSKWIGTGGTSPFGSGGFHPSGIRVGNEGARQGSAFKVWEKRYYRNLDDRRELGTRNFKVALRGLRRFVREGIADEFDLEGTIDATAKNGGYLDVVLRPERRNRTRVLMLLDVGGSMDRYVRLSEELFSAARAELSDLKSFYFHNCVYETVWRDNPRRPDCEVSVNELLATYGSDYHLIVVGDAAMSPYEIIESGGSLEHWNEEPGEAWLGRLFRHFPRAVWLNPLPEEDWKYTTSIRMIREIFDSRMEELTVAGLERALERLRVSR